MALRQWEENNLDEGTLLWEALLVEAGEWSQYFRGQSYRPTCPDLPAYTATGQ